MEEPHATPMEDPPRDEEKNGLFFASDDDEEEEELEEEEEEEDEEDEEEEEEEEEERTLKGKEETRKRSRFVEDEAEEEDDDDEEEEEGDGEKTKKRSRFIDDMAAIGDDEEDDLEFDTEDPFLLDERAEVGDKDASANLNEARVYRQLDQDRFKTDEDLEAFVRDRYHQAPDEVDYEDLDNIPETTEVEQQSLLPSSIHDPSLWLVRVQGGKELDIVTTLMQKANEMAKRGQPLYISSAIHHRNLKGYIYVEARKASYVKQAVAGLQGVYSSVEAKMVPLREMPDALVFPKPQAFIKVGEWVRLHSGLYKNDLARVIEVDENASFAKIKVVPRLDYGQMAATAKQRKEAKEKEKKEQEEALKEGRKFQKRRPPAKPFKKGDAQVHGFVIQERIDRRTGATIYILNNMEFKDGYMEKEVSARALKKGIKPEFDEIQTFNEASQKKADENDTKDLEDTAKIETLKDAAQIAEDEDDLQNGEVAASKLQKDDTVMVVKGDLKNLIGTIVKVDENAGVVVLRPKHKDLTDLLEVDALHVQKYFTVGEHVKVIRGKHTDSSGMIVNVVNDTAIIFADITQQEIKVFTKDLVECNDVTHSLTTFGNYKLFDLVALDDSSQGVIIGVDKEACQVLTTKSIKDGTEVRVCRQANIVSKISKELVERDAFDNPVARNDVVSIITGHAKGQSGTVKHVARQHFIFIECRDILKNLGIICVKARFCKVLGGEKGVKYQQTQRYVPMSPGHGLRGDSAPVPYIQNVSSTAPSISRNTGRVAQQRYFERNNRLIGKTIKLAKGPYKGYKGKVVNGTDTHVRVQLEAQCKAVNVKIEHMSHADEQIMRAYNANNNVTYGRHSSFSEGRNYIGQQTPVYGRQTPLYGSQTPRYGDVPMTPRPTPSREIDDVWNPSSTPFRDPGAASQYDNPNALSRNGGQNATAMKADDVPENDRQKYLSGVVLCVVSSKQYGKVTKVSDDTRQITMLLGSYSTENGFEEGDGKEEQYAAAELELAAPIINKGSARIVPGPAFQTVVQQNAGQTGTLMDLDQDGWGLVRKSGDLGEVLYVPAQSIAYVA